MKKTLLICFLIINKNHSFDFFKRISIFDFFKIFKSSQIPLKGSPQRTQPVIIEEIKPLITSKQEILCKRYMDLEKAKPCSGQKIFDGTNVRIMPNAEIERQREEINKLQEGIFKKWDSQIDKKRPHLPPIYRTGIPNTMKEYIKNLK